MSTKKAPMIALKSVKTLAATMLAVERLESSSTGAKAASRRAASGGYSPWVTAAASTLHL